MSVSDTILAAQLKIANMVDKNAVTVMGGNLGVKWGAINRAQRSVNAVVNRYSLGDTSSLLFQQSYSCLTSFLGSFAGGPIDPNAQGGGIVIEVNKFVNFNTGKIPFVNQAPVQILNYAGTYQQIYGNNPILAIFLENYTQDEQTPPTLTYAGNDPSGSLLSISYDYPFPVTGYIQISGVAPGSGGSGGGSGTGGAVVFSYTQADLLQDGNGSWYLPLTLTTGTRPAYTESNGISVTTTYDTTFSPARLYGFANNATQIISVYVI